MLAYVAYKYSSRYSTRRLVVALVVVVVMVWFDSDGSWWWWWWRFGSIRFNECFGLSVQHCTAGTTRIASHRIVSHCIALPEIEWPLRRAAFVCGTFIEFLADITQTTGAHSRAHNRLSVQFTATVGAVRLTQCSAQHLAAYLAPTSNTTDGV